MILLHELHVSVLKEKAFATDCRCRDASGIGMGVAIQAALLMGQCSKEERACKAPFFL